MKIDASWDGPALRVQCRLASGYHVNAHDAAVEPTRLSVTGGDVASIDYPTGELRDEFKIAVHFKTQPAGKIVLNLRYQPCDANACLAAVNKTAEVISKS